MSFTSQEYLKGFLSNTSFITKGTAPDGFTEALAQADDIIRMKTGVAVPSNAATTLPKLRNIANALVQWFTTGMQGNIEEYEYKRRRDMYKDAMETLDRIESGDEPLIDADGDEITNSNVPVSFIESTQRLTGAL